MEDTIFVEWDDRYSVGIPAIDNQHKELLNITNNLYNACLKGEDEARAYFREVIRAAFDYVRFHFSAEEKIMFRVHYPDFAAHKQEHEVFVKKILADVVTFEQGKTFVPNAFVRFLRDWVLAHIAVSDKKYSEYIMNLKKHGSLTGTITSV
jgi:hemerythrin